MNHLDEITCLLYIEGQADTQHAREVTQHTGECAACRGLLRALQRESLALSGAMLEENETIPARLLSPTWGPQWNAKWNAPSWIWVAACGLFAAGVALIWIDSISPWLDQFTNAGFGALDFLGMLLFNAPFWEGWSDMIDLIQIAAVVLAASVAFQLLRHRIRRSAAITLVMSALLLAFVMPQSASAAEVRRGQSVVIPSSETVHNDLIVAAQSVRVDGTIDGDLIAFTRDLVVTGHVTGDVIAFSAQVRLEGVVDGNVRAATNTITMSGSTAKNATVLANAFDQLAQAKIGGGLIALARNMTLDGTIRRDVLGLAGSTYLDGTVGGDTWIRGQSLAVTSTANLGGAASFEGPEQPLVAAGAKLASPLHVEITQAVRRSRNTTARQAYRKIVSYAGAVLVSLILVAVFPGFFRSTMREVNLVGAPIGIGALAIISATFMAIPSLLLIIVGIGAGIAAILLFAPIFYLAQIFVGAWLGNKILGEPIAVSGVIVGRIALGLLILDVVEFIPILGGLVWLGVILWGTGAVLMSFYKTSRPGAQTEVRAEMRPAPPALPA